jgi:hypothetical protein
MKKKFTEQKKDSYVSIFLIFMTLGILISCKNRGFGLQKFEIQDSTLVTIADKYIDSVKALEYFRDGFPLMILHEIDTFPGFYFTYAEKEDISLKYIFKENRRIVGYVEVNSKDMIVLSTMSGSYKFEHNFFRFLIPTYMTKEFDFIYFPENLYCVPDRSGFPCPPSLLDPSYKIFIYMENKIEEFDAVKVFGDAAVIINEDSDSQ